MQETTIRPDKEKDIVTSSEPQVSKADQYKQRLELAVLIEFTKGKRLKQLCRPFKRSGKQIEDILRDGLRRRMIQGSTDDPPPEVKKPVITKLDKPQLPKSNLFQAPEDK